MAISLLIAPVFIKRRLNELVAISSFAVITGLLFLSIFYWKNFPASYIEGIGLTQFKVVSEYIISALLLAAIVYHRYHKKYFEPRVYHLLIVSIMMSIFSELIFTRYSGVYDVFNMTGHLLKVLAFFLIYKGILEVGLTKPYDILFHDLQQQEKQKDELLNIASHEIKNPLTAIKAYSQLMTRQFQSKTGKSGIRFDTLIIRQAEKINNLINELMDVSRLEDNRLRISPSRYNFHESVKNIVSEYRPVSGSHKILLKHCVQTYVYADRERIEQVIYNLISNAIKYSPDGGKIEVSCRKTGKYVELTVKDYGIGIPEEFQPYIFDKYYRTSGGEKNAQGLGLGLFISKQIITLHNGEIWVTSRKNKGSAFSFTLPVATDATNRNKSHKKPTRL